MPDDSVKYPVSYISRLRMGSDGDGIRTLILMSGCPLRCRLCINSNCWDGTGEYRLLTAEEIYNKILIDRPYILSTNGGVTFGGGEPLLYPGLIREFRAVCDKAMTLDIETSLNVPTQSLETVSDCVDVFFVDIKTMNPQKYYEYTGGKLETALINLKRLTELKGPDSIVVRVPQIPGLTTEEEQEDYIRQLKAMGIKHFHKFEYISSPELL